VTVRHLRPVIGAALALQAMTACISVHKPSFLEPAPEREWPGTLLTAREWVSEGHFESADSLLAQFASRYPNSREAAETAYWRAVIGMDPSNSRSSLATATAFLDAYLAGPRPRDHLREATALRRLAGQVDELSRTAVLAQSKDAPLLRPPSEVRVDIPKPAMDPANAEAEIKRLRDELAKATAELERIRKRLAQPPPGKP
jgi:hypothetical protein